MLLLHVIMKKLLLLFYCITAGYAQFIQDLVHFEIHSIKTCKEDAPWKWALDVQMINVTHVLINGNVDMTSDLDNKITITGNVKQKSKDNTWKSMFKVSKKKGCEMLKSMGGYLFIEICKEIGRPNANCPIPKGKYFVKNKILDYSNFALARLFEGLLKVTIFGINQEKNMLFCLEAELSAIKSH